MSIKAPCYKEPAFDGGIGNLICDKMTFTFKGDETVGDSILLRRMTERNTYHRVTLIGSAGITALTAADIGFINRDGGADAVDGIAAGEVLTTATKADVLAAPVSPAFAHDVALTPTVLADAAAEVGEEITVILEFVCTS